MHSYIEKITFNGKEVPEEDWDAMVKKYINTHIVLDAFCAGMEVHTPDGILKAYVAITI